MDGGINNFQRNLQGFIRQQITAGFPVLGAAGGGAEGLNGTLLAASAEPLRSPEADAFVSKSASILIIKNNFGPGYIVSHFLKLNSLKTHQRYRTINFLV